MRSGNKSLCLLVLCVLFCACPEEEELEVGFACDFEGRCPGKLVCAEDFSCQLPPPECSVPEVTCAGSCVDLQSSDSHCGQCSHACRSNETCSAGVCVPGGNMTCAFCGPGVPCLNGVCDCQGRGQLCSMVLCVDVQQAAFSCGNCFSPCANSGEVCRNGACACPAGEQLCDTECMAVLTDAQHCGACTNVCPAGQRCQAGQCVASCTQPQSCGSESCFDVANDPRHCGSSCRDCPSDSTCTNGVCGCPAGTELCGSSCVDTTRDALNCGSCSASCAIGEQCSASSCACQPGLTRCGANCTLLADDALNCGACGNACAPGQLCSVGQCVAACALAVEPCDGFCRSGLNPHHCGGCDSECDPGEVCVDDSCATQKPAPSCTSCPCPACDPDLCCLHDGKVSCVDAFRCPQ